MGCLATAALWGGVSAADRTYSFVHDKEYEGGAGAYGMFALGLGLDALSVIPAEGAAARGLAAAEREAAVAGSGSSHLFRGVWPKHDGYSEALKGNAIPRGRPGSLSAAEHNAGVPSPSPYTSWTTSQRLASQRAKDGVVLRIPNVD